jgi:hypothetical protein
VINLSQQKTGEQEHNKAMLFQLDKKDADNEVMLEQALPIFFEKLRVLHNLTVRDMNKLVLEIKDTNGYRDKVDMFATAYVMQTPSDTHSKTIQAVVDAYKTQLLYEMTKDRLEPKVHAESDVAFHF